MVTKKELVDLVKAESVGLGVDINELTKELEPCINELTRINAGVNESRELIKLIIGSLYRDRRYTYVGCRSMEQLLSYVNTCGIDGTSMHRYESFFCPLIIPDNMLGIISLKLLSTKPLSVFVRRLGKPSVGGIYVSEEMSLFSYFDIMDFSISMKLKPGLYMIELYNCCNIDVNATFHVVSCIIKNQEITNTILSAWQ